MFELLLYGISSKFVNLPAFEVDTKINSAIGKIVEFCENGNSLMVSHGFRLSTSPEEHGTLLNDIAPNIIIRLKHCTKTFRYDNGLKTMTGDIMKNKKNELPQSGESDDRINVTQPRGRHPTSSY